MHVKLRPWLLVFLTFLLTTQVFGDRVSRALKKLQKGKHAKVEQLISKAIEKYSVHPGAHYAWSLLYFDSTFQNHNLDSAHYLIEMALQQQSWTDSVLVWPLAKSKLTHNHLLAHKQRVDSVAYNWAAQGNTIADFQHFIDLYASAVQHSDAIVQRDQLAFQEAQAKDTYQSYKYFIDTYPEALQAAEAEKRYHLLLFQSMTKGGRLQDYENFLQENPQTPYRLPAEEQIFQLQTLDHAPSSYLEFIKGYPQSPYALKARDYLFHLDRSLISDDSLTHVRELDKRPLTVVMEQGHYGFMDSEGRLVIPHQFDSIPENYLCGQLTGDLISFFEGGQWLLAGRNRAMIFDQAMDEYQDLGQGLVVVQEGTKQGLVHKGGWQILPMEFEEIRLLSAGLLVFKKGGLWGVASPNGRQLIGPELTQVSSEGDFIGLKRDLWTIQNHTSMIEWYRSGGQHLVYQFNDWELTSPEFLLVTEKDKEGILNRQLQMVVPLSKHEIFEVDSANWYTKTSHGTVRFYGQQLSNIPPDRYENFIATDQFICLERAAKWEVWERENRQNINSILYDSVARLGKDLLLLKQADLISVLFPNGTDLALSPRQNLRYLRSPAQPEGFLQVSSSNGLREVYDLQGKRIYKTWYYDMQPLTTELLIIEKNRQRGVVNIKGQVIIKPRYETIVADSPEHLTLLSRGRFGFFDVASNRLINPQYDQRLSFFGDGLLLASKRGKKGLIDLRNRTKVSFEYDQIERWSDSLLLVKKDRTWSLYNYFTKSHELENITQWQWIQTGDSKSAIFRNNGGYGLISNQKGIVLPPKYSDIVNLGDDQTPLFVTEIKDPTKDQFQLQYLNQDFKTIRQQAVSSREHEKLWCF